MDRQLSDYVARLLAHSPQIEKSFDLGRRNVFRDLELLGSLEAIARQSLLPWMEVLPAEDETPRGEPRPAAPSPSSPAVAPAAAAAPSSGSSPAPSSAPSSASGCVPARPRPRAPDFDSQRAEYKPALRNQELVEALLEFHRRNLPSRGSHSPVRGTSPTFSPQASPAIEVEQKSPTAAWRKSPGIYQPVLRSTKGRT